MVDSTGCVDAGRRMGRVGRRERPQGRLDDVLAKDDRGVRRAPDQPGAAQLVDPGHYTATLGKMDGDKVTPIGKAQSFYVVPLPAKNW